MQSGRETLETSERVDGVSILTSRFPSTHYERAESLLRGSQDPTPTQDGATHRDASSLLSIGHDREAVSASSWQTWPSLTPDTVRSSASLHSSKAEGQAPSYGASSALPPAYCPLKKLYAGKDPDDPDGSFRINIELHLAKQHVKGDRLVLCMKVKSEPNSSWVYGFAKAYRKRGERDVREREFSEWDKGSQFTQIMKIWKDPSKPDKVIDHWRQCTEDLFFYLKRDFCLEPEKRTLDIENDLPTWLTMSHLSQGSNVYSSALSIVWEATSKIVM